MTHKLYIRPVGLVANPQSDEGDAVRLGGSLVYAHSFAVIRVEGGKVITSDWWMPAPWRRRWLRCRAIWWAKARRNGKICRQSIRRSSLICGAVEGARSGSISRR